MDCPGALVYPAVDWTVLAQVCVQLCATSPVSSALLDMVCTRIWIKDCPGIFAQRSMAL